MITLIETQKENEIYLLINKSGLLIATVEPSRESKGSWSEIYQVDDIFYNIVYGDTQNAEMVFIEILDDKNDILKLVKDFDLKTIK